MKDFDKLFDLDGLKKDIDEASSGDYVDIAPGEYEVKIEKIELTESKTSGNPMVSIWFKIVAGEFKNSMIFYNQLIETGRKLYFNKEFLKSLNSGLDIEFHTFAQYGQLLSDIYVAIDGTYEYLLEYGKNAKGFSTYKIKDVFNLPQN